jgi:microsomal dipeptidase-like Zn-dependent dipeptidase
MALWPVVEQAIAIKLDIEESQESCVLCLGLSDIQRVIDSGCICIMLGLEGLEPIQNSSTLLRVFHDIGVRV